MTALTYTIVVDQGSDYTLSIPVFSGDSPETIDDWQVAGQIRSRHDSSTVLHELDVVPEDSAVTLNIPAAASSAWSWYAAYYDVELTSPDGLVTVRLIEGLVVVRPEITRA